MARVDIGNLIERWRELHGPVSGPLSGKSTHDIQEARAGFPELSSWTADELMRIFVQDSVGAEFQALPMPPIGQDHSNLDVRRALAVAAQQRVDWLTKLQNELDSFPESPKIPWGGPT
jgi:hypothetical protein